LNAFVRYVHIAEFSLLFADVNYNSKFAQSNLGRGPRRGSVAHVRR